MILKQHYPLEELYADPQGAIELLDSDNFAILRFTRRRQSYFLMTNSQYKILAQALQEKGKVNSTVFSKEWPQGQENWKTHKSIEDIR